MGLVSPSTSGRGPWRRASGSHEDRKGKQKQKWHCPEKGHQVKEGASGGGCGDRQVSGSFRTVHSSQVPKHRESRGTRKRGVPEEGVVSDAKSL